MGWLCRPTLAWSFPPAEGHTRMLELIRESGVKGEKSMKGVWAAFGQPYAPLGGAPRDVSARSSGAQMDSRRGYEGSVKTILLIQTGSVSQGHRVSLKVRGNK